MCNYLFRMPLSYKIFFIGTLCLATSMHQFSFLRKLSSLISCEQKFTNSHEAIAFYILENKCVNTPYFYLHHEFAKKLNTQKIYEPGDMILQQLNEFGARKSKIGQFFQSMLEFYLIQEIILSVVTFWLFISCFCIETMGIWFPYVMTVPWLITTFVILISDTIYIMKICYMYASHDKLTDWLLTCGYSGSEVLEMKDYDVELKNLQHMEFNSIIYKYLRLPMRVPVISQVTTFIFIYYDFKILTPALLYVLHSYGRKIKKRLTERYRSSKQYSIMD